MFLTSNPELCKDIKLHQLTLCSVAGMRLRLLFLQNEPRPPSSLHSSCLPRHPAEWSCLSQRDPSEQDQRLHGGYGQCGSTAAKMQLHILALIPLSGITDISLHACKLAFKTATVRRLSTTTRCTTRCLLGWRTILSEWAAQQEGSKKRSGFRVFRSQLAGCHR